LKDMTFEHGAAVHPLTGGDRVAGGAAIVSADGGADADASAPSVIAGGFSLHVAGATSYVEETFPDEDELFVAARFRLEEAVASQVEIVRVVVAEGPPHVEARISATQRVGVTLGSTVLGTAPQALVPGAVYRLGLHVVKGRNGKGDVEAFLAADGQAFGAAFARASVTVWRPRALRVGSLTTAPAKITFDDVRIDRQSMP
jgi:hypothetical protein